MVSCCDCAADCKPFEKSSNAERTNEQATLMGWASVSQGHVAGSYCTYHLPKIEKCQGLTYRILKVIQLDGLEESVHATRIFFPQTPLGGYSHAEISIPDRPFTNFVGDPPHQSSSTRHFRSDLHRRRPVPRLQELQVLQALCQGRREVRRL